MNKGETSLRHVRSRACLASSFSVALNLGFVVCSLKFEVHTSELHMNHSLSSLIGGLCRG